MERLTQLGIAAFLILFYFFAEADSVQLDPSSFYINKTISVERPGDRSFKFTVRARFRGEPAIRPMYLHTGVRCPGESTMKPIDLGTILRRYTGESSDLYLTSSTEVYKEGQIHVCSLESVSFDDHYLRISVLDGGPSHCDRRQQLEFIFPMDEICP